MIDTDEMLTAYIVAAFWTGLDYSEAGVDGEPRQLDANFGPDDLADETRAQMREDVERFAVEAGPDLEGMDPAQAGHDFLLTRNHHGAGFWDRGLGARGDRLTTACEAWSDFDLYVGDDGKVYA